MFTKTFNITNNSIYLTQKKNDIKVKFKVMKYNKG